MPTQAERDATEPEKIEDVYQVARRLLGIAEPGDHITVDSAFTLGNYRAASILTQWLAIPNSAVAQLAGMSVEERGTRIILGREGRMERHRLTRQRRDEALRSELRDELAGAPGRHRARAYGQSLEEDDDDDLVPARRRNVAEEVARSRGALERSRGRPPVAATITQEESATVQEATERYQTPDGEIHTRQASPRNTRRATADMADERYAALVRSQFSEEEVATEPDPRTYEQNVDADYEPTVRRKPSKKKPKVCEFDDEGDDCGYVAPAKKRPEPIVKAGQKRRFMVTKRRTGAKVDHD